MILKRDEWLFVSTMKCATNTLYKVLREFGGEWAGEGAFHGVPKRRLAPVHWTCCRNPYDRAVSIWASTCLREENRQKYDGYGFVVACGGDPLRFDDFAHSVLAPDAFQALANPWLWRNQSDWQDRFIVDIVLPVETLEQELQREFEIDVVLPRENASEREEWRRYYEWPDTLAAVEEWAGEDFARFGYEKL